MKPDKMNIRFENDVGILKTRNRKYEIEVIFDRADLEKIKTYTWSAHPYRGNSEFIITHRYKENQKWKEIPLSSFLGYGHGWMHINGNIFDFRSVNMAKTNSVPYNSKI